VPEAALTASTAPNLRFCSRPTTNQGQLGRSRSYLVGGRGRRVRRRALLRTALLPHEGSTASDALRVANERMYALQVRAAPGLRNARIERSADGSARRTRPRSGAITCTGWPSWWRRSRASWAPVSRSSSRCGWRPSCTTSVRRRCHRRCCKKSLPLDDEEREVHRSATPSSASGSCTQRRHFTRSPG